MGMLVVTALVTFFVQRQELWSIGKKAAVKMAGTAVVDVLAPDASDADFGLAMSGIKPSEHNKKEG